MSRKWMTGSKDRARLQGHKKKREDERPKVRTDRPTIEDVAVIKIERKKV